MKKETSFFTLTDLLAVACITSFGACIGWGAGKTVIGFGSELLDAGFKKLKKLTTKAEKKEEE